SADEREFRAVSRSPGEDAPQGPQARTGAAGVGRSRPVAEPDPCRGRIVRRAGASPRQAGVSGADVSERQAPGASGRSRAGSAAGERAAPATSADKPAAWLRRGEMRERSPDARLPKAPSGPQSPSRG